MEFRKAVKTKQKLRLAIDGVSGSGKTFTGLAIASGMGGRCALIDTEHGSAALYADRFDFDTLDLERFQIEDYIDAINVAANAAYDVLIIDSTSHAWDALVERVERIANQKYGGNTFRAWGEGTPLQRKLIEAMLSYPGHIIVTCRSKTEYSVERNDKGATTIKKVGTSAVQRQGFEYEFTMAMTMDANHVGLVTKDRTGKFQDQFIEKPGKKLGKELIDWLSEGAIDYAGDIKAKKNELWKLLHSKDEKSHAIFSQEEINTVVQDMQNITDSPYKKQLHELETALTVQKKKLSERIESASQIEKPISTTPASPAVSTLPPKPEEKPEGPEISDDDIPLEIIQGHDEAPVPSVGTRLASAGSELDIF